MGKESENVSSDGDTLVEIAEGFLIGGDVSVENVGPKDVTASLRAWEF